MTQLGRLLHHFLLIVLLGSPIALFNQSRNQAVHAQAHKNSGQRFTNPVLAGFYPDPSLCKVGGDYYLVNSTFSYFPGITVFHSTDLVHWNLIGYVLDRPEQLNLDQQGVSRGIFAPAIRYNKGLFYVTCTLVDIGGNFVATSKTPEGPWSKPVWLPEINGIDPSLFFDDDGKAYIVYNSVAPGNKPLYEGHRTIRLSEFDAKRLAMVGNEKILINGGTEIARKPIWIEAPHILKKDGTYYVIAAEGGTADQHSEVVFRSMNVDGPYIPYEKNPILTQRHLDPNRENPITSTGHADFVQTDSAGWWAVFLGCRPYEDGYYNTGRETFLAPVRWYDGWPVINPGFQEVQYSYPCPIPPSAPTDFLYSGNFTIRDNFDLPSLNINWEFLRTPHEQWYDLKSRKGFLSLKLRPETCSGEMNPTFLGRRQQHLTGSASIALDFLPRAENEKAGLLVFQNETHFYFLCKSLAGNAPAIQLYKSGEKGNPQSKLELISQDVLNDVQNANEVYLEAESHGDTYSFLYAFKPDQWMLLKDSVDARFLSTKVAGGFVGCMYAIYATSLGERSMNTADIDWFEYVGEDEVFRNR